jgi:hypothetical protein
MTRHLRALMTSGRDGRRAGGCRDHHRRSDDGQRDANAEHERTGTQPASAQIALAPREPLARRGSRRRDETHLTARDDIASAGADADS